MQELPPCISKYLVGSWESERGVEGKYSGITIEKILQKNNKCKKELQREREIEAACRSPPRCVRGTEVLYCLVHFAEIVRATITSSSFV
jgi:hypothetical protein